MRAFTEQTVDYLKKTKKGRNKFTTKTSWNEKY